MSRVNVRTALRNTLKDLEKDRFDEFCSILTDHEHKPRIRTSEVEKKSCFDIVKLLVSRCGEVGALERTIATLEDMGCNDEAQQLDELKIKIKEPKNKPQSKTKSSTVTEPDSAICEVENSSKSLPAPSQSTSTMTAKDIIRSNKTSLHSILSGDQRLILSKVHEKEIITDREYKNLKGIHKEDVEGHIVELVDRIMDKGNDKCQNFLDLLETDDEIRKTFPDLKSLQLRHTGAVTIGRPIQETSAKDDKDDVGPRCKKMKMDEAYLIESNPKGICLILNNEYFEHSTPRYGTKKDAEDLAEVFSSLGFRVLMCEDQTAAMMSQVLTYFSTLRDSSELHQLGLKEWFSGSFAELQQPPQHGDAFICCILSHGNKGVVTGTDGGSLPIKDITRTFKTSTDSPLSGKPKVFLIQACQSANTIQPGVLVKDLDTDEGSPVSVPECADVLVAVATVEDYVAFRSPIYGSWFIQSLCEQLKVGCSRGDDIHSILGRVNSDVSQKEGSPVLGKKKQMPEIRYTLRKKLMLSLINN